MQNSSQNPKKLFVGNLSFNVTESQLRDLYSPFGQIEDLKLITDRFTGHSKGIAFVEFSTQEEAQAAINGTNDTELNERKIIVNIARPQKPRENNSFNNRRSNSNRY